METLSDRKHEVPLVYAGGEILSPMTLPNDPYILMSQMNMLLRDRYDSLAELCASEDIDENDFCQLREFVLLVQSVALLQFALGDGWIDGEVNVPFLLLYSC